MKDIIVQPASGKLGILMPGMGAVATTFVAGVLASRKGIAQPTGSLTQTANIRLGKRTDNRNPKIRAIKCYDLSGKLLFVKSEINTDEIQFSIPRDCKNQIVIIKFEYDDLTYKTNKYFINSSSNYLVK